MKKTFLIFLLAIIINCQANAQYNSPNVVATSGQFYSNEHNSISWTIGEVIIDTHIDSISILTQGFQQPSYLLTRIDEVLHPNFDITIFPNPARDALNIHISGNNQVGFNYFLFDLNGNQINSESFNSTNFQVDMRNLSNGIYLLKVSSSSDEGYKTYKVQKF